MRQPPQNPQSMTVVDLGVVASGFPPPRELRTLPPSIDERSPEMDALHPLCFILPIRLACPASNRAPPGPTPSILGQNRCRARKRGEIQVVSGVGQKPLTAGGAHRTLRRSSFVHIRRCVFGWRAGAPRTAPPPLTPGRRTASRSRWEGAHRRKGGKKDCRNGGRNRRKNGGKRGGGNGGRKGCAHRAGRAEKRAGPALVQTGPGPIRMDQKEQPELGSDDGAGGVRPS